mmetsp:Transcript_16715/g.51906  ORF Transcript_16715/g.51906 Transcript_16715/m.51906 type:complete len:254 (+) Transcript_16715:695-1456(+)
MAAGQPIIFESAQGSARAEVNGGEVGAIRKHGTFQLFKAGRECNRTQHVATAERAVSDAMQAVACAEVQAHDLEAQRKRPGSNRFKARRKHDGIQLATRPKRAVSDGAQGSALAKVDGGELGAVGKRVASHVFEAGRECDGPQRRTVAERAITDGAYGGAHAQVDGSQTHPGGHSGQPRARAVPTTWRAFGGAGMAKRAVSSTCPSEHSSTWCPQPGDQLEGAMASVRCPLTLRTGAVVPVSCHDAKRRSSAS